MQGFVREEDRTQATGPAVAAMRRLVEAWQLSRAEAAALMGASETAWVRICCGAQARPLSQDQLTRVTAVVGVFKALHELFGDDTADRWPRLPNNAPEFAERAPLAVMIEDGIPGMLTVRHYLDLLGGGA